MIGTVLTAGCWVLAVPLTLAVAVLALQVVGFLLRSPSPQGTVQTTARPAGRVAILVPAHNEASGIAVALRTMLPELGEADRLLVVADNCSDNTAPLARQVGAEVVERSHALDRGKGYALAHGVAHLRQQPPDFVLIMDADCELAPGSVGALLACVTQHQRPAQALYLMRAPTGAGTGSRLAEFAWRVRNWVRPAGWQHFGLPCQLMGTGMAFTWDMLNHAELANASIVEDMKLGLDLALAGKAPVFCETAQVYSQFPSTSDAAKVQRTRWEHGHIAMILREAPRLAWAALARGDVKLLGLALDLAVPPLALTAGLLTVGLGLAMGLWLTTEVTALPLVLAGDMLAFGLAAMAAWGAVGRTLLRPAELLTVAVYVTGKLPIYWRYLVRKQKEWVRTGRD